MDFHGIPIGSVWTAVRWLPAAILRRFFPKERLAALQYVDLMPRNESAMIDLGEAASFGIWLQLINLSPFTVELDRAEFVVWYGGTTLKAAVLRKQSMVPGQIQTLHLTDTITDGVANQIARQQDLNVGRLEGRVSGHIEFNCSLHSFRREIHDLSGIHIRTRNENARQLRLQA